MTTKSLSVAASDGRRRRFPKRRAAILPLIAVLLPMLLILAGFAINVAYMQLCQTELQISTDIAAKAAGRVYSTERDPDKALAVANRAGSLNLVARQPLVFTAEDIRIGQSTLQGDNLRYTFAAAAGHAGDDDDDDDDDRPAQTVFNSLEVVGRRDAGASHGEVKTYFPSLMGQGSFSISTSSVSTQVEVDISLVLDRSGSMAYADNEQAFYPPLPAAAPLDWEFGDAAPSDSRWRDAVSSVALFLSELDATPMREKVALVTYSDGARVDQALTHDYSKVIEALLDHTQNLNGGGTNIAAGLQAGEAALAGSEARDFAAKVAIILTDGKRSVGNDPIGWAKTLSEQHVMVIAVTFSDEADQATMKKVAQIGNGFHVHARNRQDLNKAFREIGDRLPTLLTR